MELQKTEEKKQEELDIKNSKELNKQVDRKSAKKIFINIILAIVVMVYFCSLSIVYNNVYQEGIIDVVKIATLVFLAITLLLIEIAYNKESKIIAIHALEMLAFSIHSLSTMHVIKMYNFDFKNYISVSSYIFSIYYVLKTIIINTKERKQYLKEMSDISEIIKKEEPKKKEAIKKEKHIIEEKKKREKIVKKEKKQEIKVDAKKEEIHKKDIKEESVKNNKKRLAEIRAKLRELQKQDKDRKNEMEIKKVEKNNLKEQEENKVEKQEENVTPPKRKRGRPRKSEQQVKEANKEQVKVENKEEEKKEENVTPPKRKRGRPKKEVKIND